MPALNPILNKLDEIKEQTAQNKEILLANLVMAGEIPAETFKEQNRKTFMLDRFRECGLDKISTDEVDNAYAILPGKTNRNILVSAHMDTLFPNTVDHTVRVEQEVITGAGIADNSLGVAVVTSLPTLLQEMGIQFQSNILLMGASRSLGRGNLQGISFFLENFSSPIEAGIFVEGVNLGRVSYNSLGMLRGEVMLRSKISNNDSGMTTGTIESLAELISKLQTIPIPNKPKTQILLGSCHAGKSFNKPADEARLRFEVTSEEVGMVSRINDHVCEIIQEIESESGLNIWLEEIARRKPGGIGFSHPLTSMARKTLNKLRVTPTVRPSMGELSALIDRSIPGLTLGITKAATHDFNKEAVYIEPMYSGIAQLIAVLMSIDEGICNESKN